MIAGRAILYRFLLSAALAVITAAPAAAQSTECELMLLTKTGPHMEAEYINAARFLERVYDGGTAPLKTAQNKPIRAVMCARAQLIPTMRDLPILQTGLPLSLSENFDDPKAGLLTVFDAGKEFRAEYSGPTLSPAKESQLRDRLEIFNLQKLARQ